MGPFEDKARGQLNVDEVVASGIAAAAPNTTTTTTGRAPGAGIDVDASFKMEEPAWNWRPTNQDFVPQPDVAQYNFDTGLVPVARTGQVPFAALANRQAANAERKAALQKKLEEFDLYANVGNAAVSYQRNFGKMARADMDKFVDETADFLGIDDPDQLSRRRKAMYEIATNPELKNRWIARSKQWEEIGQQSQALSKDAIDYMIKSEAREIETDPETYEAAMDLAMGTGAFGTPDGPDVMTQVEKGRRFERMLSREKFFKEFITPGIAAAVRTWQEQGKIDRVSGMVRLTETEKRDYDGLIDANARRMSAMGYGTYEEVSEYLRKRLPGSVVVDTKLQSPPSGGRDGGGLTATQKVELSSDVVPFRGEVGRVGERTVDPGKEVPSRVVRLMTGTGANVGPRVFQNDQGDNVRMYPLYIQQDPAFPTKFYVVGESATGQEISTEEEEGWEGIAETKRTSKEAKRNFVRVPVDGNEKLVDAIVQGQDWRSMFDQPLPEKKAMGAPMTDQSWKKDPAAAAYLEKQSAPKADPGYTIGQVTNGYEYLGGPSESPSSWRQVKK